MTRRLLLCYILLFGCLMANAGELNMTVTSYCTVSVTGDQQESVHVSYEQIQQTHRKSQLTAGDQAILLLTGLTNVRLDSVRLMMRSNTSSGAGALQMSVDNQVVWQIADHSFSADDWYGAFSNEYVPICHYLGIAAGPIELLITSTQNSIYLQQITLYFSALERQPNTVHFACYDPTQVFHSRTETAPGEGIQLPPFSSSDEEWQPLGWTESPLISAAQPPVFFAPYSIYYPQTETTLYALFVSAQHSFVIPQHTQWLTADDEAKHYIIVDAENANVMASSPVVNKQLGTSNCLIQWADSTYSLVADYVPIQARFLLKMENDSVLIKHYQTDSYIGYKHTKSTNYLANLSQKWCCTNGPHHSVWFYHDKEDDYAHFLCTKAESYSNETVHYCFEDRRFSWLTTQNEGLLLFDVTQLPMLPADAQYSTAPEHTSVETIFSQKPIINWEQEVWIYTMDGRLLAKGNGRSMHLNKGMYMVRQADKAQVIVRGE